MLPVSQLSNSCHPTNVKKDNAMSVIGFFEGGNATTTTMEASSILL